jgi:hypothetical protein
MMAIAACGPVLDPDETIGDSGDDDATSDDTGLDDATGAGPTTTMGLSVTSDEPTTEGPVLPNLTGDHLLAVAIVIAPETPLQFLATVTQEDSILRMSLQPLSLDPGATTGPRKPVGAPIQATTEIAPDGTFVVELGEVLVTGEANPITGSDIVATLLLEGTVQSSDAWCGDASGAITQPLRLDLLGSTFAGTRVVGELPGDPILAACGP